MLFQKRFWAPIAEGRIQVAFRRWKRPTVKAGGTLRSPAGMLRIEQVEPMRLSDLKKRDAEAAGYDTLVELKEALRARSGRLYRIRFRVSAAPDPRAALAGEEALTPASRSELDRRLDRMDAARSTGPWTRSVLELIRTRPGIRAGDLAEQLGRARLDFKRDVRKLKALGLTESLKVGYQLSPRGRVYLGSDGDEN